VITQSKKTVVKEVPKQEKKPAEEEPTPAPAYPV